MSVEFSFVSSKPGKKQHVFHKNKTRGKQLKLLNNQSYCNKKMIDERQIPMQYSRYKLLYVNFKQVAPVGNFILNISIAVSF